MKKFIVAIIAAFVFVGGVFAANRVSVGAKVSSDIDLFNFKLGEGWAGEKGDIMSVTDESNTIPTAGVGVSLFVNVNVFKGFEIQPEFQIHYKTIVAKTERDPNFHQETLYNGQLSYATVDIPLVVGYRFDINDKFFVRPEIGPKISFVLGEKIGDYDVKSTFGNDNDTNFYIGVLAGVTGGVKISERNSLTLTARFNSNLNQTEFKQNPIYPLFGETNRDIGVDQFVDLSLGFQTRL